MEIAAGGELYDYLSEKKCLEEREAKRIFRQGQILPNFFRRYGQFTLATFATKTAAIVPLSFSSWLSWVVWRKLNWSYLCWIAQGGQGKEGSVIWSQNRKYIWQIILPE